MDPRAAAGAAPRADQDMSLPRDALRVLAALLLFFAIGRAHQHYSFIGAVRPALLLFVLLVGYSLLKPSSLSLENVWRAWPPKVVVALGVLACLSVPFGISMGSSGRFVVEAYSKVLVTFFILVAAIRHPRDLRLFVWTYVLACGFLVYITIFTFSLQQTGGVFRLGNLYMYDANDMGLVLVTGLPLAVVLFQNSGKKGRLVSGTILLGIGASLARSGSRGGFLGLLAVGIALLFLLRGVSVLKRAGFLLAVVAGLFVMAPEGYWEQMRTMTEPTEDYNWQSDYGRKAVAERGVGYMLDYPLFGVGIGNFGRAEGTLSEVAQQRQQLDQGFRWTAAHNSFVQIGAELGLPGLILFCVLIFGGIFGMFGIRRRAPPDWAERGPASSFMHDMALYLPVSLIGFAVSGFFVSFAYHDVTYALLVFVTGVYLCAPGTWSDERSARAGRRPRPAADRRGAVGGRRPAGWG